jgi:iron(III) transport system substrate-binding protein
MKRIASILLVTVVLAGCGRPAPVVVCYTSTDQVFAEPVLKKFEARTGIKVKAVYDTEEAKSTGVMNRLLAERDNPQADVYWANEPIRAEILRQKGIAASYKSPSVGGIPDRFKDRDGYWTGFSARSRVLIVNKAITNKPRSILAYIDPARKGRGVVANPLFGTTTVSMAALFELWGDDRGKSFLSEMKVNSVKVSTSNGESADFVAAGTADFSLVDSDDAENRVRQGKPVEMVLPDQGEGEPGCLIVPNAAVLIKGGPNAENGKRLIDFLLSQETERMLAFSDAAQIPLHEGVETPPSVMRIEAMKTMEVDYAKVARKMQEIQSLLKEWGGY